MDGPRLQGEMDTDLECKHDQLEHITVSGDAHDTKLTKLASLKDDVTDLRQRIKTTDKGTGVLSSQSQACDSLYANVESQEGVVRQAKANEEEERRLQALRDEQIGIQDCDVTMASSQTMDEIDLFLIGKTGNGKSSTGNAILGRQEFEESDGSESETYVVKVGWTRNQGRVIKVVDCPGVCETRISKGDAAKKMCEDMTQGILQSPKGFHALVLVLKYGNRFTEEELQSVQMLKSLFGPDFIRDFCIIMFTHGDVFESINRNNPRRTFQDWLREQKGALKTLLEESSHRTVLFDNSNPEKYESQLENLLKFVDNLKSSGVRYTSEVFKKAADFREQFIVRENAPELIENIEQKINLLMDGVEKLKQNTETDEETTSLVSNLKNDVHDLYTEIAVQDKGTGVLDSLGQVVVNVQETIASHEEALRHRGDKVKMDAALVEAQKKCDENLAQLRGEVQKAQEKKRLFRKFGNFLVESFYEFFPKIINILSPGLLSKGPALEEDH